MSGVSAPRHVPAREVFQRISYLQYPALFAALAYAVVAGMAAVSAPHTGWTQVFEAWNHVLLYAGIGIGLSSLQDPRKTQNEMSRRVWQDPRKGRWALILFAVYALGAMLIGLIGAYRAEDTIVNQLSLGLVAFGLGMVGLLKTAIEMREHHRSDRHAIEGDRA